MRILEIEPFGRGGLAHYVHNLALALAARGHQVTVITAARYELHAAPVPPAVVIRPWLAAVTGRPRASRWWRWGWIRRLVVRAEAVVDAARVAVAARRLRPDVIHLHSTNPIAVVYLALLRLTGQPVASTAHVVTPHERIPAQSWVYRRIHRLSTLVVAHSEVDRDRLLTEFALAPARVTVIPHGEYGFFRSGPTAPDPHAARTALGLDGEAEVVLFFGYIREYKGLDLLLAAWPRVAAARPRARLVVAGDPVRLSPARTAALAAWADRVGAVHRFAYVPFDDVATYFTAADVMAMPYRHISHSGVLFLALALGVPVVATRVGPLPAMFPDGDGAVLVPPGSAAALGDALGALLGDPARRARLAAAGRRVAARHAWTGVAERTEAAFRTLGG